MKLNKACTGFVAAATLAVSQTLLTPPQVNAGTNGQQVRVNTGGYMRVVSVTGRNQAGRTVTSGSYTSGGSVTIPGWWKGDITVKVDKRNWFYTSIGKPATRTCTFNVPTFQWGDIYTVTCN